MKIYFSVFLMLGSLILMGWLAQTGQYERDELLGD